MHSTFQLDAGGLIDLHVLWEDSERALCRGRRLDPDGSPGSVLIVFPAGEHPAPAVLDRLAHEYDLKDELDAAWAARPLDLVRERGRTLLLLEDPGGEPLESLIGEPMQAETFLRFASDTAAALSKAHSLGLVHKDLKPANIFVNCATGAARLLGFGFASRLPRERRPPEPPEFIAGTLAYMAPEQTGRMNRSIDGRSDLYALGVTFYQMLTGVLPFSAADPMEWVHCHIARKPSAPAERCGSVPGPLSDIVMKLLAKTADERYQTAAGLEHDLRRCLSQWEAQGRFEAFPLGERDAPDRLLIAERLYGREPEIDALLASFDRVVAGGGPELVLVAGEGGVGKSAVVHELGRALVPPRALFASGKFDQLKRDIPYATIAQALQDLIRPLLGKSETELAPWRAALTTALGPNGALMVTLVPELEALIGPQPPAPELSPRDAQRRFQLLFGRVFGVFARPEHPLALFLDDLQWLDAATLDLLEDLLTQQDLHHLLLIGAYRDDEVTSMHPLIRRLARIRQAGGGMQQIVLRPLSVEHVTRIVADTLHSDRARPLARLVHEKTAGNPFFAIQFLSALVEEGLLVRDAAHWAWDLKRIRAKGYTDKVVDLMLGKLRRLPVKTQNVLKRLACLGNSAPIKTLARVQRGSESALHATLGAAVQARLVFQQEGAYKFLHDRVREAAYALIPVDERATAHLTIGRRLAARTPLSSVEDSVFEMVGQLNRGTALISSAKERERLAELNLIAGRRARAATAYSSALTYFNAGAALLPANAWKRRHDLAFALELHRAECEFLTGALTEAEAHLAELVDRAARPPELATLARLRVDLFMTLGRSDRAVAVGLECLRRFNIAWPAHPTRKDVDDEYARLWALLGDRPIEGLLDLPRMEDPIACVSMDVLTALVTPALWTDENLRCLLIGRMGNLALEHGNSDVSGYAYTAVGNVLGLYFGDYEAGFRFGQLGLDFVEQSGMERLKARVYLAFGNLAKPSARHTHTGHPLARYAFESAQQVGDLTYAGISCNNVLTQLLASGAPLANVQREAEVGLDFARRAGFGLIGALIGAQLRLIRTLRGLTPVFGCFNEDGFEEAKFEEQLQAEPNSRITACMYFIRKLQARVLANDHAAAFAAATKAERLLWMSPAIFERADYHFYAALSEAALCDTASATERTRYREAMVVRYRQLQQWAEHCPESFTSRAALVGAEIARLEGRELDAERLYEQAVRAARDSALVHNEAMAHERASAFYQARGFEQIATLYLRNARHCYLRWGADGKVRQLEGMFPQLREEGRSPGSTSTIGAPVEHLDLATVIKVSQALSSEISPEKLVDTLLRLAVEQAGAERGLLIFSRRAEPRIEASARTIGDSIVVELCNEPVGASKLPLSVLRHVLRTSEIVVLDDAVSQQTVSADPYIVERRVRSILCVPLLNRTELTGVLYLENNLSRAVFSTRHIAILKLLASQAAITLENALLYRDLHRSKGYLAEAQRLSNSGTYAFNAKETLYWSEGLSRIWGFDALQTIPSRKTWWQRVHPDDRDSVQEGLQEALRQKRDYTIEYRIVLPDGTLKHLRSIGHPSYSVTGELVEVVGTTIDVTERKRAQEEHARMRQLESDLAHLNRVSIMGELTASLAHEVLHPIATARNNARAGMRFLDLSPPNLGEVRDALDCVVRDADRAKDIVGRIRDHVKKTPPRMDCFDLNDAIAAVLAMARGAIENNKVSVSTRLMERSISVRGDRVQLQQVVLNLVLNAVDAMSSVGEGVRELSISTELSRTNGILVAVRDSGPGIDPEHLDRVFKPFYTTKPSGMGMGLSICKSIIAAHGGRLWADANQPRGAIFQFTLPAADENS